ncbi:MAG TPA: hypothetical protein PLU83_13890, partial [Phycicoccus sp.]|nr:hypothetical protein [Phycicoccus sp.]
AKSRSTSGGLRATRGLDPGDEPSSGRHTNWVGKWGSERVGRPTAYELGWEMGRASIPDA